MAWIYYNPNPYGKIVDDCTVRALCKLEGWGWLDSYMTLCIHGAMIGDLPNANSVMRKVLEERGYSRHIIPDTYPNCYTVADFATDNQSNICLACTGSHVIAVVDGDYYDTADTGYEIPLYFYKKEN